MEPAPNVTLEVGSPQRDNFQPVEATVDTGSDFTALPAELLRSLGVSVERTVKSWLADGSEEDVDIGVTWVRVQGIEVPTQVIFAPERTPALLGVVTLEETCPALDPTNHRLIPTDLLRY